MKKLGIAALLGFALTAFSFTHEPVLLKTTITELTGYRLRNSEISLDNFNLWVVTTETVFDEKFVAEHDHVTRPDFACELVVAGKVQTFANAYTMSFKRMELKSGVLHVYFTVRKTRRGHSTTPVAMSVFPKDGTVKKVNFYHDNVLVSSIPVNNVY